MNVVYLDSSALVKRYVEEAGTDRVSESFQRAYSGEHPISYSAWNIGEVIGALGRAKSLGRIHAKDYSASKGRFLAEARRMIKLGVALVVPVRTRMLAATWELIQRYQIYEADALQLVSAAEVRSTEFMTGDRTLHDAARGQGLNSLYLG